MLQNEILADVYDQQRQLLALHVADLSDADLLVRPAENANHAAWMLGHLSYVQTLLINVAAPGAIPVPGGDFMDRYGPKGTKLNDGFATKEALLAEFERTRNAAIEWVLKLTEDDVKREMPKQFEGFAPTVGHLAMMVPVHDSMHLGQIQVIRRKLGKPVLF